MPRVTHVKRAQQRYKTVPVMGEDGQPKKTPVMSNGVQKTTKRGEPVFMKVTKADKSQPLPELACDYPGCDINGGKIAVGSAYKHITPKSGPYGGTQRNRHDEHPDWNVWEYSDSTGANVARIQSEGSDLISNYEFSAPEDFDSLRDEVAELAQGYLDEKQERLDAMPEHLASDSELAGQVEALGSWVEEIEGAEAPNEPDTVTVSRFFVQETGVSDNVFDDDHPDGFETEEEAKRMLAEVVKGDDGEFEIEEREIEVGASEVDEVDEDWAEEAKQAIQDALDNCEA